MVPGVLVSSYLEYKRDTDSIAIWLASTAKANGFDITAQSKGKRAAGGGRLKGKSRTQAKKDAAGEYQIRIRDFTALAEYILKKSVAVPQSFRDTLNRAIVVRSRFAMKLKTHNSTTNPEADAKHENFIDVLKGVRAILAPLMPKTNEGDQSAKEEDLLNRFASLSVFEPSQDFLNAPDAKRPEQHKNDRVTYTAEVSTSLDEAILALWNLVDDMNGVRSHIKKIWDKNDRGEINDVAAAIATNSAVEIIHDMVDEILPLMADHGGIFKVQRKCFILRCEQKGHNTDGIQDTGKFGIELYDLANASFITAYDLVAEAQAKVKPGQAYFNYTTSHSFDPNSDWSQKTSTAKYEDDRALFMPFFSDMATVVKSMPRWPVHDACLRGVKEMMTTGVIPFSMVFATQVFLDINYTLGSRTNHLATMLLRHTGFLAKDVGTFMRTVGHKECPLWRPSDVRNAYEFHDGIIWLHSKTAVFVQQGARQQRDTASKRENMCRLLDKSPVISGLMLYHYRMRYRDMGLRACDAWACLQSAQHLYNAACTGGGVEAPQGWSDMAIARLLLGDSSFYVGGIAPRTRDDQVRKFCLQMGVSATTYASGSRSGTSCVSRNGPRRLVVEPVFFDLFAERYVDDGRRVITAEVARQLVEDVSGTADANAGAEDGGMPRTTEQVALGELTLLLARALSEKQEPLMLNFPYLAFFERCRLLLSEVRRVCEPELRRLVGPYYIEGTTQSTIVAHILRLADGSRSGISVLGPLRSAAKVIDEMIARGDGVAIIKKMDDEIGMYVTYNGVRLTPE